jgi:hypothetical protein
MTGAKALRSNERSIYTTKNAENTDESIARAPASSPARVFSEMNGMSTYIESVDAKST